MARHLGRPRGLRTNDPRGRRRDRPKDAVGRRSRRLRVQRSADDPGSVPAADVRAVEARACLRRRGHDGVAEPVAMLPRRGFGDRWNADLRFSYLAGHHQGAGFDDDQRVPGGDHLGADLAFPLGDRIRHGSDGAAAADDRDRGIRSRVRC